MNDFAYKNNDRIKFNLGTHTGTGRVIGCSTSPAPVIGRSYMIQLDTITPELDRTYPFRVISAFESQLEPVQDTRHNWTVGDLPIAFQGIPSQTLLLIHDFGSTVPVREAVQGKWSARTETWYGPGESSVKDAVPAILIRA